MLKLNKSDNPEKISQQKYQPLLSKAPTPMPYFHPLCIIYWVPLTEEGK